MLWWPAGTVIPFSRGPVYETLSNLSIRLYPIGKNTRPFCLYIQFESESSYSHRQHISRVLRRPQRRLGLCGFNLRENSARITLERLYRVYGTTYE
jgi:hypothetical protein